MEVRRFESNPIVTPSMVEDLVELPSTVKDVRRASESTDLTGLVENVNGPSLIRAPPWVDDPLGEYYLYFANHQGQRLYLAYADTLAGPWSVHGDTPLRLEGTPFVHHVASPDVHVFPERERVRLYYHGVTDYEAYMDFSTTNTQCSSVAQSGDGLSFSSSEEVFGTPYLRRFEYDGISYFLGGRGRLYRSADGLSEFETGPTLFPDEFRHPGVLVEGDRLQVYYSNRGDRPERILRAAVDLDPDWQDWSPGPSETVLEPECDYEGANLPLRESSGGFSRTRVREVRDPSIYVENGRTYLLYSVSGERGIAIAELVE